MRNKILSLVLILMLVGSLVVLTGCGESSNEEDVEDDSEEETSQVAKVESKWYWSEDEDGEEVITDGEIELHIGDTISYDEQTQIGSDAISSYTSKKEDTGLTNLKEEYALDQEITLENNDVNWVVLGLDEETGEILIVSEELVYTDTEIRSNWQKNYYVLYDKEGYENGINELNHICEMFGYGEGASGARSMTIEDVNGLTGYDPEIDDTEEGELYEYGNKITYTLTANGIEFSGENGAYELCDDYDDEENLFMYYDGNSWKKLSLNESITLTHNAYGYYSVDYPNKIVFFDLDADSYSNNEENNYSYWLASDCGFCYGDCSAGCGLFYVAIGDSKTRYNGNWVSEWVSVTWLRTCDAENYIMIQGCGIRPVVSLSSDVELSGSSSDGWEIE